MKLRVALVAAVSLSDCLDPTEIRVVISTDVPCTFVNSTAIAVGQPGDDGNLTRAKTTACSDDGGIGTLVVTPSRGIDEDVGIRVTLGLGAIQADECVAPKFEGCIVARRSLAYDPHTPLTLPIAMQQICADNFCDPSSTCVNGACVDAGIPTCDPMNTCTIDAGVGDAGPCTDLPPRLAVPVKAPVTPHLVQTTTGYAIGFETTSITDSARAYDVIALDSSGNPGKVWPITTTLVQGTSVGPLGTDGTNFIATFVPASSSYGFREIDPNGLTLHEDAAPGVVQLPLAGMRYESSGPGFVFFFIAPGGNPTFEYWPLSGSPLGSGVGAAGANDTALAWFNGVHYGSYQASGACGLASGTFTVPAVMASPLATFPLCTTLRVAENAKGVDLAATREGDNVVKPVYTLRARASFAPTAPPMIVDAVDDQAIIALPGVGNQFHIVYGVSQTVRETTIDTTLAYTAPKTISPVTGYQPLPGSIGFDAIAEPNTMTHDIAFWASTPTPGIYFTRICH